ncbi:MAG: cell division protein ZapA [Syntrophales bacterium]|nr:cell division protein ZapA [Syntrophales bacterium]MCK9527558.1 cell division protein ZapA [Syntrophales bacterium]MDX9922615.1 cell division protein ZapA [Syntrophales bacterium]
MKKRFDIRVMDRSFSILSDKEDAYVESVVDFVNNRAQETRKTVKDSSDMDIAILVALNIADELFEIRRQHERDVDQMEIRTAKLIDYISAKEHIL